MLRCSGALASLADAPRLWRLRSLRRDEKRGVRDDHAVGMATRLVATIQLMKKKKQQSRPTVPCDGAENEPVGRRWEPAETL